MLLGGFSWAIGWVRNIEYISDKAKDSNWWNTVMELMSISQLWLSPALLVAGFTIIAILYIKRQPRGALLESGIAPEEQEKIPLPPQFNVTVNIDGKNTATNQSTLSEYDPAMKSFVKFTVNGTLEILDSYNIASVTENGARDFTVTFDHSLDRDDFTCAAAGTGTVNFKIAEQTRNSARIEFGDSFPDIVHLTFD